MTKTILVTGATGYIGGKLLNRLSTQKYHIKALARFPENLYSRIPGNEITICQGDVLNYNSLLNALDGVDIAFYLVHSMGAKDSFEELDRQGAENFSLACKACGVKKIIYLGGLGSSRRKPLSTHMRSRQEVGKLLSNQGIQTLEFRSSIILGAGSLSYEMMKALVEKLPVMVAPKWINYEVQPIHIDDVLDYLIEAIEIKIEGNKIFEIGGSEKVSYKDFMLAYADIKGLKRYIITVPVLTPHLSSLWLALITPLYKRIGRKLIESIVNDSIVLNREGLNLFSVQPKNYKAALKICIERDGTSLMDRKWYDAVSSKGISRTFDDVQFKKKKISQYVGMCEATPAQVYGYIQTLGGKNGWYAEYLWKIRGAIDLLFGGVGFRRLRRDPNSLKVGDPLDFWRVVEMEENKKIVLKAEMKLPGLAFLNFELSPQGNKTLIKVEPFFLPIGLWGEIYWYLFLPFHGYIFRGLLHRIEKGSEIKTHSSS